MGDYLLRYDQWFCFEAIAPIVAAKLKNQKEYSYQRHDERHPPPRTTKNKTRNQAREISAQKASPYAFEPLCASITKSAGKCRTTR
jgi:hypothetical protein